MDALEAIFETKGDAPFAKSESPYDEEKGKTDTKKTQKKEAGDKKTERRIRSKTELLTNGTTSAQNRSSGSAKNARVSVEEEDSEDEAPASKKPSTSPSKGKSSEENAKSKKKEERKPTKGKNEAKVNPIAEDQSLWWNLFANFQLHHGQKEEPPKYEGTNSDRKVLTTNYMFYKIMNFTEDPEFCDKIESKEIKDIAGHALPGMMTCGNIRRFAEYFYEKLELGDDNKSKKPPAELDTVTKRYMWYFFALLFSFKVLKASGFYEEGSPSSMDEKLPGWEKWRKAKDAFPAKCNRDALGSWNKYASDSILRSEPPREKSTKVSTARKSNDDEPQGSRSSTSNKSKREEPPPPPPSKKKSVKEPTEKKTERPAERRSEKETAKSSKNRKERESSQSEEETRSKSKRTSSSSEKNKKKNGNKNEKRNVDKDGDEGSDGASESVSKKSSSKKSGANSKDCTYFVFCENEPYVFPREVGSSNVKVTELKKKLEMHNIVLCGTKVDPVGGNLRPCLESVFSSNPKADIVQWSLRGWAKSASNNPQKRRPTKRKS